MQLDEFENIINESLKKLPDEFRDLLKKNQIQVIARETVPAPMNVRSRGKIIFGVFIGVPYGRFFNIQTEPTRIELYKESFEKVFASETDIKTQILKTVIHEIAHYFGFSESEIRHIGY